MTAAAAPAPGAAGDIDHVATSTLRFASGAVGGVSSACLLRRGWRIALEVVAAGLRHGPRRASAQSAVAVPVS